MAALVRYDEMCRAIDAAYAVDEVKQIRDRAIAFEHYARLARNIDAERQCALIRVRAEKKAGHLSKQLERAQGRRTDTATSAHAETKLKALQKAGISRRQATQWEKLDDIPDDQFEEALAQPGIPTTNGLIEAVRERRARVSDEARSVWWQVKQLGQLTSADAGFVASTLARNMREDLRRDLPGVIALLSDVQQQL